MAKTIKVASGESIIVSNEDFEYLSGFNWRMVGKGYAARDTKTILMHRVVLERKLKRPIMPELVTDHINKNKLDNRRENLRELSQSENVRRSIKQRKAKTSRFRGVSRCNKKWRIVIRIGGKIRAFGTYDTEEKAATIYAQIMKDPQNWKQTWNQIRALR